MEPHAVVQAGAHEVRVVPAHLVGGQDGVEERHVRRVGGHAGVQQRDRRAARRRPGSTAADRARRRPRWCQGRSPMWRWSIGWGRSNQSASSSFQGCEPLEERRQGLGRGHVRHGELVLQALLGVVEGGRQVEDGPAVLHGHDAPGGERPAVADPVDLVEDGDGRVAGPQEVRVQRVDPAVLDRAPGRHQRLPGHLAAEHPLALLVGLDAPEDVDLNGFEVEQVDEEVQGRAHRAHVRRRRSARRTSTCRGPRYPAAA